MFLDYMAFVKRRRELPHMRLNGNPLPWVNSLVHLGTKVTNQMNECKKWLDVVLTLCPQHAGAESLLEQCAERLKEHAQRRTKRAHEAANSPIKPQPAHAASY